MVKEFKVGTIFELGRVLLRCTKGSDCTKCYFLIKNLLARCSRQKWWDRVIRRKEMIMNMSSLKKWARCVITARRIRENLTDYWGVSVKSVSLLIKSE